MSEYLIQVNVAANGNRTQVQLMNYLSGQPIDPSTPMRVAPGDRIAWYVQVYVGSSVNPTSTFPYVLRFFRDSAKTIPNTSFFGVSSLSGPRGGTSPFVHARPLQETISYSLEISGFGLVLDPEMQTGNGDRSQDFGIDCERDADTTGKVIWDQNHNTVQYGNRGGPVGPFPPAGVNLGLGDMVAFEATGAGSEPFAVQFAVNLSRTWASPFLQAQGAFPLTGYANSIAPPAVSDGRDPAGTVFAASAQTASGKVSPTFQFLLS